MNRAIALRLALSCTFILISNSPPGVSQGSVSAAALGVVRGFVRDSTSGEALPYANVICLDTPLGAATDRNGYYVITGVPPGTYRVRAGVIGYSEPISEVELKPGATARIDFLLSPQAILLEGVEMSAKRAKFQQEVIPSIITIDNKDLVGAPALAEPDLFRTLQMLPGVSARSDFSSQLYVRGGSPDQNLILLDGVTVYNPYHLGGVFSTFNVDAIKEAELMTGGFPARYGGRISSVLNIVNREGNSVRYDGSTSVSLLSAKGFVEGPIPRGSFFMSGRRTYFDQLFKATKFEFPYYFYDFQGKANVDLNSENRLTVSGYYGDDVLDFDLNEQDETTGDTTDVDLLLHWGNRTLANTWRSVITPRLVSRVLLSRSSFFTLVDVRVENDRLKLEDKILDYSLKADLTYFLSREHQVQFGYEFNDLKFNLDLMVNSDQLLDFGRRPNVHSIYGEDRWSITDRFTAVLGSRLGYFSLGERLSIDPRASFRYQLNEDTNLKAAWGIYHQYINTGQSDEENFQFIDFWFPIDEKYRPERASHYVLGLERWLPGEIKVSLETYYKDMADLLDLNNQSEGEGDDYIVGDGWAGGVELLLKRSVGPLSGWLGYSYAFTKRNFAGTSYFPKYDRRNNINLVLSYNHHDRYKVGAIWSYGSGTPYSNILGKFRYFRSNTFGQGLMDSWKYVSGPKNGSRYPAYHRLDVSFTRNYQWRSWRISPYLQVINIYNHKNIFLYFWDHESQPSIRRTVNMFPFVPTFGVKIDF